MSIEIALGWARRRTCHDVQDVARRSTVSVVRPARNGAAAIGSICRTLARATDVDGLLRPANEEEGERPPMATLRSQVPGE